MAPTFVQFYPEILFQNPNSNTIPCGVLQFKRTQKKYLASHFVVVDICAIFLMLQFNLDHTSWVINWSFAVRISAALCKSAGAKTFQPGSVKFFLSIIDQLSFLQIPGHRGQVRHPSPPKVDVSYYLKTRWRFLQRCQLAPDLGNPSSSLTRLRLLLHSQ